jgi:hypothetical protein
MNFFKRVISKSAALFAVGLSLFTGNVFAELYISEYAESTDFRHLYIEVTNGGDSTIDLRDYSILTCIDVCSYYEKYAPYNHSDGGNYDSHLLASGASFVLTRVDAATAGDEYENATLVSASDGRYAYLQFDGIDAVALVKEEAGFSSTSFKSSTSVYTVIDVLGTIAGSGSAFAACGIADALSNRTLVKKPGKTANTSWSSSAGTNADDCDWIVKDNLDFDDIGDHTATLKVWDFNNSANGFEAKNNGTVTTGDTFLTLTLDAASSGMARYPKFQNTDASIGTSSDYVAVTMRNRTLNTKFVIGVNLNDGNDNTNKFVNLEGVPTDEDDFTTRYFDMSGTTSWTGSDFV